jgi:glucose uptake protein
MTLPHTYAMVLMLTILTMICWGSWTNVLKFTKGWRFELLYYDYSIGVALGAVLAGLTFGTWGADGFGFMKDLSHAGGINILSAFAGGVVYNLSNILVVGAIAVAGMGVGFPIGVGLALVVGVILNYVIEHKGNPVLLFAGVALIVAAIIVDAIAYRAFAASKSAAGDKADVAARKAATWKGIKLAGFGGVLMGLFYPLVVVGMGKKPGGGEFGVGLGPYAVAFVFGLGVLVSIFFYNLYFLRFPIDGPRLTFGDYRKGSAWYHLLGIIGGVMWIAGSLSNWVAASAPATLQVGPAISYAIGQGSCMVGALWGVLVWKEFAGGGARVNRLLTLMFLFYMAGLITVSIAPLYAAQ